MKPRRGKTGRRRATGCIDGRALFGRSARRSQYFLKTTMDAYRLFRPTCAAFFTAIRSGSSPTG